jgi:hypothetical protein
MPGNALVGANCSAVPLGVCWTQAAELAATRTMRLGLLKVWRILGESSATHVRNHGMLHRTLFAANPANKT